MKGIHMMRLGSIWAVHGSISRSTVKKLQDMLMLAALALMVCAQDAMQINDSTRPSVLPAQSDTSAAPPFPE